MEVKATAYNALKSACSVFTQDLEALPESAFTTRFGEKTRTVADIVFEVNLVNDHIGMVLRGEEPFPWPEGDWITAPKGFSAKEQVIAAFKESSDRALATIESFTEEQMEESVETEHGPRTRFQRFQFMTLHLWYHSGQLNFMQTLLGDDKWHWS